MRKGGEDAPVKINPDAFVVWAGLLAILVPMKRAGKYKYSRLEEV